MRDILRIVAELRETGVAILLVEQNARAALQIADRGYVLETGEVVLAGSSAELAGNPRVVESYLGFGGRAPTGAGRDRRPNVPRARESRMNASHFANPLLQPATRPPPRRIAVIGAGAIGPDIAYYLKTALPQLALTLIDIRQPALDAALARFARVRREGGGARQDDRSGRPKAVLAQPARQHRLRRASPTATG